MNLLDREMIHPLIPVAEVTRPHGIRGELQVRLFNPDSEILLNQGSIKIQFPNKLLAQFTIEEIRNANKICILKLQGVDDRTSAEKLKRASILVEREKFLPLSDPNEYYACDIVGASVYFEENWMGKVSEVVFYPTCQVLRIAKDKKGILEIPFTDAFVESVNIMEKSVHLSSLEWNDLKT